MGQSNERADRRKLRWLIMFALDALERVPDVPRVRIAREALGKLAVALGLAPVSRAGDGGRGEALAELCELIGRVDALAGAAEATMEGLLWRPESLDRRKVERLAELMGATRAAIGEARAAGAVLTAAIAGGPPVSS